MVKDFMPEQKLNAEHSTPKPRAQGSDIVLIFSHAFFSQKQQELINWSYDILINGFTPAGMSKNRFNHQATYTEKNCRKNIFQRMY